jgi:hypothetical protein
VYAPVQDALLVGGPSDEIRDIVTATRKAMAQVSDLVLDGFVLQSNVNVVHPFNRYFNKRGIPMWNRVTRLLDVLESAA